MVVVVRGAEFELTAEERGQLVVWARESSRLGQRARIVLACADPEAVYARVAREVGVSVMTVNNVRGRFTCERLDGLLERSRSGRPKAELVLAGAERDQLQRWARRPSSAQSLALRSKIVLACADGGSNVEVAPGCGYERGRLPSGGAVSSSDASMGSLTSPDRAGTPRSCSTSRR